MLPDPEEFRFLGIVLFWYLNMTARKDFSLIQDHPKYEEIVSKLVTGVDPIEIQTWLKMLYPEDSALVLSLSILEDFQKSGFTDFYGNVQADLLAVKQGKQIDKKVSRALLDNRTYQERLNTIAEEELNKNIDIKRRLNVMEKMIGDRFEQLFDIIQENPKGSKGDHVLLRYMDIWLRTIEFYNRAVNNAPDQIIQHNHSIEYFDKRASLVQDAVRDVLMEMDPELSLVFVDKLNAKMEELQITDPKAKGPPNLPPEALGISVD